MGNKILGKRSKSFYRGFNERQIDYLKQKFQTISINGKIDKQKFKQAYKINDQIYQKFMSEADFNEDANIDQYQFICMVHSFCSLSIQELSAILFRILTKGKAQLNQKNLYNFTSICLDYNSYIEKTSQKYKVEQNQKTKINKNKFEKYDIDKNLSFDQNQFAKICLKDQDYKKWMFNMGFISKRQMQFQDQVYQLIDSDMGQEVERHDKQIKANVSNIKMGIQHRIGDQQFQIQQQQGQQSAFQQKPWVLTTKNVQIRPENPEPPNQSIEIQYVFGYRSFDCRNNVKYDSKGNIVYHQAAIGIVLNPNTNTQNFIVQHHEDITCLDVNQNIVVTGQTGAKPSIIMWDSIKTGQSLTKKMVITQQLKDGISCIALSQSMSKLAAICNDQNHKLIVYDLNILQRKRKDPTLKQISIISLGPTGNNIPFDLKFDISEKSIVLATIKQLTFISFEKGTLNANRGVFGNFTLTPALCLQPIKCTYKKQIKQFMLSGMGNGSIYFWEKDTCVKALCGHNGSVSAICARKDMKSFVSGDRTGTIIIWNQLFQKQKTINIPKSNSLSNMIVALSCSQNKDLLVGTKGSDIFTLRIGDGFERAKKVMSGHCQGKLNALAVHRVQNYLFTGGEDRRLMKWEYKAKKVLQKQRKCSYPIRSIDLYNNQHQKQNLMVVGYKNGVVQLFDPASLQSLDTKFDKIKNPDEQVLNLVRINKDGTMCLACYLYPKFKIILINIARRKMKQMKALSVIQLTSKVIAIDFDKQSTHIRFNTGNFEYFVYNIDNFQKPVRITAAQQKLKPTHDWATHTLPFSPETQGVLGDGVTQSDIVCCQRTRKIHNVFAIGDKFSKIKLFNYPSKTNKIYNKYVGHSNEVTGLQFDRRNQHLISIGGEQKSIIIWKYNPEQLKNQNWVKVNVAPQSDIEQKQISEERKRKKLLLSEFDAEVEVGQRAMATKPFLGQVKYPSDFKQKYNARRDNKLPEEDLSIRHVFGLRNKYLNDQVRNQVKFTSDYKSILFPTACLAVKMSMQTRDQQFYHAHKQDIVSFAVDPTRKIMATGQMAQRNPLRPTQKIVSIYVWDIQTKQILKKLDGFLTVAIVLLSFSPNGKLLYACGNDDKNTYAIYDWISGSILYSGPTSRAKVNGITWKNNQQYMTCGMDHVKFWEGKKSQMGKINGKNQSTMCCVSSDKVYITGSATGGIYVWLSNQSNKRIDGHSGKIHALIAAKGYIYSGGADGYIKAWKTQSNGQVKLKPQIFFDTRSAFQSMLQTLKNIPQEQFGVLSLDFSDKNEVLIGTHGASIIYYNGKKSQVLHQGHYRGQLWGLTTQVRKNDDNLIVTSGDDRSLRIWDIQTKRQVNRVYMQNKVRGIDWASDGGKIVVGDSKAKIYLFNRDLSSQICSYTGKPFALNSKNMKMSKQQQQASRQASSMQKDPFIQQIKFSPNCKMIAYGTHGISNTMQILNVENKQLVCRKQFNQGSSAVLHIDWSRDSDKIAVNNQAYQYRFFSNNGTDISASACADQRWATMSRKFGFQVKGIFQGVDYTDVNTVCKDPTQQFLAVGYDDQTVRIFRYPCYIQKQVHKTFYGHSSHVTRIKFTSNYMVSLGGLDRTIIVWNIIRPKALNNQSTHYTDEDDGLDDLQEDVDLPSKATIRKPKQKKIEQFYAVQDQGDQFMAIKPWLGAIKQPTYQYPKQTSQAPKNVDIKLQYVHGYRVKDCRQNLYYIDKDTILFHAAAVVIFHNISKNTQNLLTAHNDDILSIDYHRNSNQVITGELGPKPLVCLFRNQKLVQQFIAPVKKGVLAVAISPDGNKAVCAGMDEDHTVALLDLGNGKVIATAKGTKKVITKIVWTSATTFVTCGISHFKTWSTDKGLTPGRQSSKRYNIVSAVYDDQTKRVFTGASKGTIVAWNGSDPQKQQIQLKTKDENGEQTFASVVDSLLIQKNHLLAGTKDGLLYVIDKKSKKQINVIILQQQITNSRCLSIRALNILGNKLLIGTLGSEIYECQYDNLTKNSSFRNVQTILRCHYSPNNTWTNEVWGLHVHKNFIFTCSDDATVRCWSISDRKLLSVASTNIGNQKQQLQKDKKTKDFTDAAKSRAVSVSPDGKYVVVGSKNGIIRIYSFQSNNYRMTPISVFRHAKQWISDIKFAYNMLIVGSHDNGIYVYDFQDGKATRKYAPLRKHSSYITHLDVSRDSCFLQSTCGAYQLLFWDLNVGKQITAGASLLKDQLWSTWTCNLGWPVQGIYPKCQDGTFINSVDRSNFSVNNTRMKDDTKSPYLLAAGNDHGQVCLYNYPCTIKSSKFLVGRGHSSHVTTVRWKDDDKYLFSVGGQDQCLMYWKVDKK